MFKLPSTLDLRLRSLHLRSRLGHRSLGIAWLHGTFHLATYHRAEPLAAWHSPAPVRTIEEFTQALSAGIAALKFTGVDTFILLAHETFVHQSEQAPPAPEPARIFLRNRIEKFELENKIRVLSATQRSQSARQDWSFFLHLLPSDLHEQLVTLMRLHRLELTRIVPLTVPLQIILDRLSPTDNQPQVLAIEAGESTALLIGPPRGDLYISRTITTTMAADAARIGTEINRSILFAKQQFAAQIDSIHLLGDSADFALPEIQSRSGPGKTCHAHLISAGHLLDATATLPINHPINLVADHLRRKRRHRLLRRLSLAACWGLLLYSAATTGDYIHRVTREKNHVAQLLVDQPALEQERATLSSQTVVINHRHALVEQAAATSLPPVPTKVFPYFVSQLPPELHLTDTSIRLDSENAVWVLNFEGTLESDAESAQDTLANLQRQLARSPLATYFHDQARALVALPQASPDSPPLQRFVLEATLFTETSSNSLQ